MRELLWSAWALNGLSTAELRYSGVVRLVQRDLVSVGGVCFFSFTSSLSILFPGKVRMCSSTRSSNGSRYL